VPVIDKSQREDGTFSREDFIYDEMRDVYPQAKSSPFRIVRSRRSSSKRLLSPVFPVE
jgi:hypothetical protein